MLQGGLYIQGTQFERDELINSLKLNETILYNFDNVEFDNLLDIYKYSKKKKISSGLISNKYGVWGDVKNLLKHTKKQIIDKY